MLYKKVPFIQQMSELDCGAACLTMILHYYNNRVPLFEVSRKCSFSRNGLTLKGIIEISMSYGLESRAYKLFDDYGIKNFKEYLPAILLNKKGHYVVLEEINKRHIVIVDPEIGKRKISVNENLQDYFEAIVILKKTSEFVEKKHYINNVTLAIKQNMGSLKKLWGSIILSFAIEVCSLILPICTQIIIDGCLEAAYEEISSADSYFRYSYQRLNCKIPMRDILYFESKRRKVYIVTEKETFEFYGKLNEIEESLRASKGIFLRIHQSFLINYKHIKGLAYDFAVMDNEERLSISEDRRKLISKQYCAMEDTFYVGM